jgi:thiol-disulfide isomerase/thioredoxin
MRALLLGLLVLAAPLEGVADNPEAGAENRVELLSSAGLKDALSARRGHVVVLNLWATWCSSCLKEIPDLMALEQELHGGGLTLIAISMDDPAELARVAAFRDRFFPAFRTYLRDEPEMDDIASVVDPAFNELLPTTYLIGRDGKVVKRIQGKRTLDEFRAEVSALLD